MSDWQKANAIMMQKTGKFSIKEIAYACGATEWTIADMLIACGALKRR